VLADRLHLQAGRLRLELAPDMGGSIAALDWMDGSVTHPVMRDGRAARNVLEASSFPLVPFVNRIRGGSFRFGRREVRLAPNMAGDPNPLHGQGWLAAWQVAAASESRAVLCFRHEPGEWPWAYEARQEFSLNPDGLFVRLSCRNASDERMPCGLGQHPYFPCGAETRIDARVDCAWNIDAQVLPTEKAPATGRYDLAARSICAQDLDNGFGGWSGEAVISDPEWPFEVRLSSPGTRYFHIYSPPSGSFFAAEPVTHANAALNEPEEEWPMVGLKILEPGEEMSLDLRIELVEKLSGLGDR
jgi:aldose 1-epimerase